MTEVCVHSCPDSIQPVQRVWVRVLWEEGADGLFLDFPCVSSTALPHLGMELRRE